MEEILNLEMALKNPPPEADSNELEKKVNKWVRIIATKIEQKRTHFYATCSQYVVTVVGSFLKGH